MISRISGTLARVDDDTALIENGGVYYEIMLPSALADRLKDENRLGQALSFETIYYIEAGDRKSTHFPRLVGFLSPIDREFFSMLTQVSGLGVKKALRSLTIPIRDIAGAIENKDSGQLNRLPGIGARLADKIIAELHGKVAKFALSKEDRPLSKGKVEPEPFVEEALEVLLQLQYSRTEAQQMIDFALKSRPKLNKVEDLITIIFRNEQQKQTA
jgi:Holliday junction DNA helicase RuvA